MTDLPDDVEQLKAMLMQLQKEKLEADLKVQTQQEEIAELETKVQLLVEQLNLSKSKRFSTQSEKTPKGTFNEAEQKNAIPKSDDEKKKRGESLYQVNSNVKLISMNLMRRIASAVMSLYTNVVSKPQKS